MTCVIVVVASYVEGFFPPDTYLESCDFEAYGGRGKIDTTMKLEKAKRFADFIEATNYWKTQSKTVPLRDDGRPNRPLSSMTIEIRTIDK